MNKLQYESKEVLPDMLDTRKVAPYGEDSEYWCVLQSKYKSPEAFCGAVCREMKSWGIYELAVNDALPKVEVWSAWYGAIRDDKNPNYDLFSYGMLQGELGWIVTKSKAPPECFDKETLTGPYLMWCLNLGA